MIENTKTPKENDDALLALLKKRLNGLIYKPEEDPLATGATLLSQAAVLDCTFRQLIARGVQSGQVPHLLAALKAQNQYRYTVRAVGGPCTGAPDNLAEKK